MNNICVSGRSSDQPEDGSGGRQCVNPGADIAPDTECLQSIRVTIRLRYYLIENEGGVTSDAISVILTSEPGTLYLDLISASYVCRGHCKLSEAGEGAEPQDKAGGRKGQP